MSRNYKIRDKHGIYFVSFATTEWVDVFTRQVYRDILIDSIRYCQKEKGLIVYSWCLMSNHIHLIIKSAKGDLSGTIRDMKKHTSKKIIEAIEKSNTESRKEWMLELFRKAGSSNSNNQMFTSPQSHSAEDPEVSRDRNSPIHYF